MRHQLWPIAPATYARHALHRDERAWPESNCSVDVWIELLHARGFEPLAALPFTLAVDLEGDQWTFFKFPPGDLHALYGVDIIEVNVWRPLIAHIEAQLALERPSIVEVDGFYLPDTAGTCYHAEHVKTSIAVQAIDREARRLGYFHNAGYFELEGRDFAGVFRLEQELTDGKYLAPYVEAVKFGARPLRGGAALARASLELLASHLQRKPADNPFHRYAVGLRVDLDKLREAPLTAFHGYAFATFRQFGAAFELAAAYLRWLQSNGERHLEQIAADCDRIATTAVALQLKTARLVSAKKPFDPAPMLDAMADAWDRTMMALTERYGALAHHT